MDIRPASWSSRGGLPESYDGDSSSGVGKDHSLAVNVVEIREAIYEDGVVAFLEVV